MNTTTVNDPRKFGASRDIGIGLRVGVREEKGVHTWTTQEVSGRSDVKKP